MKSLRRNRAVFLDRDGVINADHGFVCDKDRFDWNPGAREAIRYLNHAGYLTIVVTNQSGIARGYYSESDFRTLHRWIDTCLREVGARIDAVYYCPHLPDASISRYRADCECRKPRPGMLLQAIGDLSLDPARSFLIGDKETDCLAAAAAGIASHLYQGFDLLEFVRSTVEAASVRRERQ